MPKRTAKIIVLFAVCAVAAFSFAAPAAQAAQRELVKFRLMTWKAAHFDDEKVATEQAATLEKIGCEVKQHKHGDHFDVSYRCTKWRSIAFKTHKEAHEWEHWLKKAGFETQHEH